MSHETVFIRAQFDPAIRSRLQLMELVQLFARHTVAAMAIFDRQMRYLFASQRWLETYDLQNQELIGHSFYETFPELASSWREYQGRCFTGKSIYLDEEPYQRIDGTSGWRRWEMHPWHERDRQIGGVILFSEDITKRKKAEEDLLRFRLGIERSASAVFLTDAQGRIVYVNQAFEYIYGYTRAETLGQTPRILKSGLVPQKAYQQFWQTLLDKQVVAGEIVNKTKDGRFIHIEASNNPIVNEQGSIIGFLGIHQDITERKQAAESLAKRATELAAVAEVSTVVASAASTHELLQQAADLTKANFGLYHAHIYQLNEQTKELILVAGAGDIGRQMVQEGRRIPLRSKQSLVARAARTRRGVIVNDVRADEGFLPHPLLPKTRSEMAVPLIAGDQLLGVLDVQAEELERFSSEDINIQTTLAAQIAVALQNARQHEATQATLEELNTLQRTITRQGWQAFMTAKERPIQGYQASKQRAAQPLMDIPKGGSAEGPTYVTPLVIRGANIGGVAVRSDKNQRFSIENRQLLESVSQQVAEALERARLAEQTELAREQTAALYAGSDRVVRSTTIDDILQALIASTALQQLDQAALLLFDRNWDSDLPTQLTVAAAWEKSGAPPSLPVSSVYSWSQFPFLGLLERDKPVLVNDIAHESSVDDHAQRFLEEILGMRSAICFPLVVGGNWIGLIFALSREALNLQAEEIRQISSLADQAAAMSQTQHLLTSAQRRARHEQILRQVTARVSGSFDVDTVMKTAVEEIGRALGRRAYVRLEQKPRPRSLAGSQNGASNGHG